LLNRALSSEADVNSTGASEANYYVLVSTTQKVIDLVVSYLSGEISIRELRVGMARASVEANAADTRGRQVGYHVEHRLAEFTNGDWSEDELRDLLRPLVRRYTTTLTTAPPRASRKTVPIHWKARTRSLAESA
jgi:hypothetical protein